MRGKQLIKISSPTGNVEAPERGSDLTIPPSLEELDFNDYGDIAYWSHDDWKDAQAELKLDFICDEGGKSVDHARLGKMTACSGLICIPIAVILRHGCPRQRGMRIFPATVCERASQSFVIAVEIGRCTSFPRCGFRIGRMTFAMAES